MLNEEQKLNKNIFQDDVEKESLREGFGKGLLYAGQKNEKIVGLTADLTSSTFMHLFKEKFPERFVQIGIAEQNLASVASGLSVMGKIPVLSSYASFSPGRNWEQIRTTICYNNLPAIIVGSHAGVSTGPDGGTHQALEDIALMRVMPNMNVICPCDSLEAEKATIFSAELGKPVYIRLSRDKTPVITTQETPFEFGKAKLYYGDKKDSQVAILACGPLLYKALKSAKKLSDEGIKCQVWNFSTIKPLDTKTLLEISSSIKAIVTVEEHQKMGGFGSAVAEFLSENKPKPISFVGVDDKFGQSGTAEELLKYYKIDEESITKIVKNILSKI